MKTLTESQRYGGAIIAQNWLASKNWAGMSMQTLIDDQRIAQRETVKHAISAFRPASDISELEENEYAVAIICKRNNIE